MLSSCTRCSTRALASPSTRVLPGIRSKLPSGSSTSSNSSTGSTTTSHRANSNGPDIPTPKRPSPYRLIPVSSFLADFAPLHVKGWRLDVLPNVRRSQTDAHHAPALAPDEPKEGGMVELQDRRLTRRYDFERGKDGWRDLLSFMQSVGELVEAEDHHPTIRISPAGDITAFPPVPDSVGYVLSVSSHTHTPLPPLKYANKEEAMRPGVTGKDMKLALKLEELYESRSS